MEYFTTYLIYIAILSVLLFVCSFTLFKKLGINPIFALIPFYNYIKIAQINKKPIWWVIFIYFPVIGPIMMSVFHLDLQKRFGKNSTIQLILGIILPFIYLASINFSNAKVEDLEEDKKETFVGSVTFAIVFATFIHLYITQPFTIPTASMERTLLVGDFLFVNKHSYGYRLPMRPVALPFLQGTILDTGKPNNPKDDPKSYIDAIRLPYLRLPGLGKVKRNDIVVFNYPGDSVHVAIDRKDSYVKRCVAIPGDVLEMKEGKLLINNKPEEQKGDVEQQQAFQLLASSEIDVKQLWKTYGFLPYESIQEDSGFKYYFQGLTKETASDFNQLPEKIILQEVLDTKGNQSIHYFNELKTKLDTCNTIFPVNKNWNPDWYGPIKMPKKGDNIVLNVDNYPMYYNLIKKYEHNKLEKKGNDFYINDVKTNNYTVKLDYYFMMGDNRDASLDSRFFGFVPETHIVGSPMFTWMSIQGLFDEGPFKIRWDRMFKATNTGEKDKHSYWYIAVLVLIIFFGWEKIIALLDKNKKNE